MRDFVDSDPSIANAKVRQAANLTYRVVDGKYYVTNPERRELVVLNEDGFKILQAAHDFTVQEIYMRCCEVDTTESAPRSAARSLSRDDILTFLGRLREVSLIDFYESDIRLSKKKGETHEPKRTEDPRGLQRT